jgi:hypothetical protein
MICLYICIMLVVCRQEFIWRMSARSVSGRIRPRGFVPASVVGWPIGMRLARSLKDDLRELRSDFPSQRIAFFALKSGAAVGTIIADRPRTDPYERC